jgi:hypothetical protein
MTSRSVAWVAVVVLLAGSAAAQNPTSKPFRVARAQSLSGVLKDIMGVVVPKMQIQLLDAQNTKVMRSAKTDQQGRYDLGAVEPGEYRLRLKTKIPWCAPAVDCSEGACHIQPVRPCVPES